MDSILKSWKTTVMGVMIICGAMYAWSLAGTLTIEVMGFFNIGFALIFTKDADVTGK